MKPHNFRYSTKAIHVKEAGKHKVRGAAAAVHCYFTISNHRKRAMSKGQKMSNRFFQVDVSSQNRKNEFYFTIMKPQVDLFNFICFLEEIEDAKQTFQN